MPARTKFLDTGCGIAEFRSLGKGVKDMTMSRF
jgi:sugar O-acyltransferase (sialic acid O-acetyltransferase NeuD family)